MPEAAHVSTATPVIRSQLAVFVSAAWLLSSAQGYAGGLSAEVDGINVEMTSSPRRPGTKGQTEYVVRLVDRSGQPVSGARVMLRGAMADGMSVAAPLRPAVEAGVYRGQVLYTMEGQWELMLRVTRDGKRFELPLSERVER